MKLLEASDVFESSKFCYIISKIYCFYFATYTKDKNDFYTSKTRIFDVTLYVAYIVFGFYWTIDLMRTPPTIIKSRSVILELFIDVKSKIQITQPFITLSIAFYYRHNILEILKKLNKIDKIVSNFAN